MDRRRGVLAAAGVSAFLLMGTAAFAVGSGALSTHPVDRVGTFQAIEARLVPTSEAPTTPASTSTTRARPARSEPTGYPTSTDRPTRTDRPTAVPVTETSKAPVVVSPSKPAVVAPVTTTTIAGTTSVPVRRKPDDDATDNAPRGGRGTDD